MDRRIFGLETEYGVACTSGGTRRLTPDEVARYLFRRVVTWGVAATSFCATGPGSTSMSASHPEYATAECDDLVQLINHDRAGERILGGPDRRRRASARQRGHHRRHLPVQEQHRQPRQLLRLPRELPDLTDRRLLQDHRRAGAVPGLPAADLWRRQGAAHRPGRRVQRQPARRAHLGERVVGAPPAAGRSSTPATSRTPTPSATAACTSSSATPT